MVPNIIGQSDTLCWVVRDISQRKAAEAAVYQAHAQLEKRVQERTVELSQAVTALEAEIMERRRIDEEKTQLLEQLQQQHIQLRALTGQLTEVQESERKQLARELHDQVGQSLTALGLNLNTIGAYLAQNPFGDGLIRTRLDDSLVLVDQTTASIRDVMAHLRPPVLDDYGLVAALRWYGNRVAGRTNFAVTVQGEEPDPRLPAPVENMLFRITQEALTNATKHAQASHVIITVETDQRTVCLTIADDGIGFEVALPPGSGEQQGWGLISMSERAETVGGRCRIESIPGDGTQVIVEAPR
jgi:two-component system sensor histidine kinase UhpB